MGYKVLVRSNDREFLSHIEGFFEEEPLTLLTPMDLDWSDINELRAYIEKKSPHIVVNYHISDAAEELQVIENLVQQCREQDIPILHFSSYRVFGRAPEEDALGEDLEPAPKDALGKHLAALEAQCAAIDKHLIVRLSWMLDGQKESLLRQLIVGMVTAEDKPWVSDHDFGYPLSTRFVARTTLALVQQILCGADNWGIFHLRSSDISSEAEVCDAVHRLVVAELDDEVAMLPVSGIDDERRILEGRGTLIGERCTNNFGVQLPSWRKGLKSLVKVHLGELDQIKS